MALSANMYVTDGIVNRPLTYLSPFSVMSWIRVLTPILYCELLNPLSKNSQIKVKEESETVLLCRCFCCCDEQMLNKKTLF